MSILGNIILKVAIFLVCIKYLLDIRWEHIVEHVVCEQLPFGI